MPGQVARARRAGSLPKEARTKTPGKNRKAQAASAVSPISMNRLNGLAGYLIRRAQLWVFNDLIETLAPLNIRPAQYSVLTVISENPGLSQMALAHALKILRSGIVPLIDGLEERGLVKRALSATDRRSHALHLTEEGKALLARIEVLVAEHEKRLIWKVGPRGHKQLLDALATFGRK